MMLDAFKRHWPHYLAEAAGLGFFMVVASGMTTLLRSPFSPIAGVIENSRLQLVALGLTMGLVIMAIVYSPWGRKSGAHINPAVTLAFWRIGKIKTPDALFYVLFQFLGATFSVQVMGLILGAAFRHPDINYVVTKPGPGGPLQAFIAEAVISFILMLAMFLAGNSREMKRFAGAISGVLIALYLIFEEPYSGMSLNPARSSSSAFAARDWTNLWIYFVSPPLAMLLSCEVFMRLTKGHNNFSSYPMEEPTSTPQAQPRSEKPFSIGTPIARSSKSTANRNSP